MSEMSDSQASFTSSQDASFYYAASPPPPLTPLFQRFPLLHYIQTCGLPLVHAKGKATFKQLDNQLPHTIDWPKYHNLIYPPGVRLLKGVTSQCPTNEVAKLVKNCQFFSSLFIALLLFLILQTSSS